MKLGGIDEAGRGPVVGPLVIAAVVIDESKIEKFEALGVKDSKKLSPKKREELFEKIIELVDDYFILELSPEDIDKREGTMNDFEVENFAKVLNSLKIKPDLVYIDAADVNEERFGIVVREKLSFYPKIIAEHKADSKYIPVAAASILAKVTRDKAIERLKEIYGSIGSGYPSDPITRKFLEEYYKEHGSFPPVVRRSWKTLKKIEEKLQKEKNQSNLLNFLKKS